MQKLLRLLILILSCMAFRAQVQAASWYDLNWEYRKKITIVHTNVVSDLTNFPVLVSVTNSVDFQNHAHTNGSDFVITASDGTTKLYREIEAYSNGTLVLWFNAPSLSSNTPAEFYIYYGNPSGSETNDTATWDANYVMVQHLQESPANSVTGHLDSTSYGNNGAPMNFGSTATSTTNPEEDIPGWDAAKKIDGADVFNGVTSYVNCGTNASMHPNIYTLEAWIKYRGTNRGSLVSFSNPS
ncbi:DUF2341 domain-containing protein, partial [Verrucomicrobiota bacterium]